MTESVNKFHDKEVAVVWIVTGYTDGSIDFTQDAPRKDFAIVRRAMLTLRRHINRTIADGDRCPYSPAAQTRVTPMETEDHGR